MHMAQYHLLLTKPRAWWKVSRMSALPEARRLGARRPWIVVGTSTRMRKSIIAAESGDSTGISSYTPRTICAGVQKHQIRTIGLD